MATTNVHDADQLAGIVQSSNAAIVSLSTERLILSWNGGAETLLGRPYAEMLGRDFLPLVPTDRQAEALRFFARAMSGEAFTVETSRLHETGRTVDVLMSLAPMRDVGGAIIGACAVMQDISGRKAAERETQSDHQFLERALLNATERESRRIGQELHDHLCQQLLGAAFGSKAIATSLPKGSAAVTELNHLAQLINSAVQQTRHIARGMNPVEIDSASLLSALREFIERPRAGFLCRLECEGSICLPEPDAALHAYRIVQEAVSNAVAHSGGSEIVIRLQEDEQNVYLQISDNGCGFQKSAGATDGCGLEMMNYRVRALAGKLALETAEGGGTRVSCVLPKRTS